MVTYINKVSKVSKVFIDKISVTLKVPFEYRENIPIHMDKMVDAGYAKKCYTGLYYNSIKVASGSNDQDRILVQCNPKSSGLSYFRIEFNPSKSFVSDAWAIVDSMIPDGHQLIVKKGVCTRLDLTVDINNEKISDFFFWYPKYKKTSIFFNASNIETYYLGVKSSPKEICIYDKTTQVKKMNKALVVNEDVPTKPITRVEVRIRSGSGPFLYEIIDTPNPFLKLGVSKYANQKEGDWSFNLFLKTCNLCGAQEALISLPEYIRKKYKKLLSEKTPTWWDAEKIWSDWPCHVNELLATPSLHSLGMFSCKGIDESNKISSNFK